MRAMISLCAVLLVAGVSGCAREEGSSPGMDQTTPSTTTAPGEPTTPPSTDAQGGAMGGDQTMTPGATGDAAGTGTTPGAEGTGTGAADQSQSPPPPNQ